MCSQHFFFLRQRYEGKSVQMSSHKNGTVRAAFCGAHKRAPPHLQTRADDTKVCGKWHWMKSRHRTTKTHLTESKDGHHTRDLAHSWMCMGNSGASAASQKTRCMRVFEEISGASTAQSLRGPQVKPTLHEHVNDDGGTDPSEAC